MAETKSADQIFNTAAIRRGTEETGGFNVIRYPMDLATPQHPHYVMFFINVRSSDIRGMANAPATVNVKFDNTKMNRPSTEGAGRVVTGIAGAQALGALGREAGRLVSSTDRAGAGLRMGAAGAVLGGVLGAAKADSLLLEGDRTQVLLKDVIALYMAGNPVANYSASWGEENTGLVGAFADSSNPLGVSMDGITGLGNMAGSLIMKGSESAGNRVLGNAGLAYQAAAAMTPNPFKAQLFKNMKFRNFGFDYTFLPKDANEYNDVKRIINLFKKYMHPTLGTGKFVMKYPAEFSIAYYYKEGLNTELFRISNCALTDLTVSYGGTDFVTFRGKAGAPTEITMKMKFVELEMLTQERFETRGF